MKISASSDAWVAAALADLPTLLVDHAHCERKAAQTALRFLSRYPDREFLTVPMSRLAREELVHFERVMAELRTRKIGFRPLPSAGYAAALFELVKGSVDEMLVCALIEARSHERFERLASASTDERLRSFYEELAEAEARHGDLYVGLAESFAGGDVQMRLEQLTTIEAEIIARPSQPLRMHAGGL